MSKKNEQHRRKQITFDLNQKALSQYYPRPEFSINPLHYKKAYRDISRFMAKNGFEHRQFSVYTSREELTEAKVVTLTRKMAKEIPWLVHCVNQIDVTDVGAQHSLLAALTTATSRAIKTEKNLSHDTSLSSQKKCPIKDRLAAAQTAADQRNAERSTSPQQHNKEKNREL